MSSTTAKVHHWILGKDDPPEPSTLVERADIRSHGGNGPVVEKAAVPVWEIKLADLPEILKKHDVLLQERDGEITGWIDDKGRKFRVR